MKTEEEIIQELNNWVETQKQYGSIRQFEDGYEYIDLLNNLFTRGYEISNNPNHRINTYPEHLDLTGVGTNNDNWLCNRINSSFEYDIEILEKLGTSNQLKSYLNDENYLTLLTNEWYNKMIVNRQKNKDAVLKKHEILAKLKDNISEELYLQVWKELFNKNQ